MYTSQQHQYPLYSHAVIRNSTNKKRGPKTKIHRGPLPEHLKLLARLCVKHDGPGNITYWGRIFEEASEQCKELMDMIEEKKAKYATFKKSRLRFLVDRQYRQAFNEYRASIEVSMGRTPSSPSVVEETQSSKLAVDKLSKPDSQYVPTIEPTFKQPGQLPTLSTTKSNLPETLQKLAYEVAKSEIVTGGAPCWDCLKRHNDVPELQELIESKATTLNAVVKSHVWKLKNNLKSDQKLTKPAPFDYRFTVEGIHYFQEFLRIYNGQVNHTFTKEERAMPEIFREYGFHLARHELYKKVHRNEWSFLLRQPMCLALRTLVTKNRKVLVKCQQKDAFQTYLAKIKPCVKSLEQTRMGICKSCAGNVQQPNERDDAANALLFLASTTSDYSSDGSG